MSIADINKFQKELYEAEVIQLDPEEPKLFEDGSVPSSTGVGGVDNPDAKPMIKKTKFMGIPCIEVDDDTYTKCIRGKKPFSRWAHYVEDENLRNEMRKAFQSSKKLLMKNSRDESIAYVKA